MRRAVTNGRKNSKRGICMEQINLTLRQRKILNILQGKNSYLTGAELAKRLNVTVRTIRNDVATINSVLQPYKIRVDSVHSKGYALTPEASSLIPSLVKIDTVFFTKEDRVRYLAIQLCLSDIPLDLGELEDEIYVSQTTLKNDLHKLRLTYCLAYPYIRLRQDRGMISFEDNEKKRRAILNILFSEHWNYNGRSNAFYGMDFLGEDLLNTIMDLIPVYLNRYGIMMEDANIVSLNLACAIMYVRVTGGHILPETSPVPKEDYPAYRASEELCNELEHRLKFSIPRQERDEIYVLTVTGRMLQLKDISMSNISDYFGPVTMQMADDYLRDLREIFHLNFAPDEDFYYTLLQFTRDIRMPYHIYNDQEAASITKENLLTEIELAWLFQRTASRTMGSFLDEKELLHLAHCMSGALEQFFQHHPEHRLRTVICCHLHMSVAWAIKRKLLSRFGDFIDLQALLPVNAKNTFDFSNTDLILSTVHKPIAPGTDARLIVISPFMNPEDTRLISEFIQRRKLMTLSASTEQRIHSLLREAVWEESDPFDSTFPAILKAASPLLEAGLADEEYVQGLLRREAISSCAFASGMLLQYSLVPAKKTRISFLVFRHRMNWGSYRIRAVATVCFAPEERSLVFAVKNYFCYTNQSLDISHQVHCAEDLKGLLL